MRAVVLLLLVGLVARLDTGDAFGLSVKRSFVTTSNIRRGLVSRAEPEASEAAGLKDDDDDDDDVNFLMTRLNRAIAREDYQSAADSKARLDEAVSGRKVGNWETYGAPGWLQLRLAAFGMIMPTPIQAHALEAMNNTGADVVIAAPTGSGKTLAFAVPLLSALEPRMLARRERIEVDLAGIASLAPRVLMTALSSALWAGITDRPPRPPSLRGPPLAIVLAPSRLLAQQLSLVLFSLVGGNMRKRDQYTPNDPRSIFQYKGPKGARIVSLASDAEVRRALYSAAARRADAGEGPYPQMTEEEEDDPGIVGGYDDLEDCDVLVADVETLRAALAIDPLLFEKSELEFVTVDEADALDCQDLVRAFGNATRVLVGASLAGLAASTILPGLLERDEPREVLLVDETGASNFFGDDRTSSPLSRKIGIPAGLRHSVLMAPRDEWVEDLSLCLRRDIRKWEDRSQTTDAKLPRPRVVVFAESEAEARVVHFELRDLLWQVHAVAALLPTTGGSPTEAARSFSSDAGTAAFVEAASTNAATVLVTSPEAARGLDFPNVTHVYRLGDRDPALAAALYAHEAGRCGRVGQEDRGSVTTFLEAVGPFRELLASQFAPALKLEEITVPTEDEATLTEPELAALFDDDGTPRYFKVVEGAQSYVTTPVLSSDDDDDDDYSDDDDSDGARSLLESLIRDNSPTADDDKS